MPTNTRGAVVLLVEDEWLILELIRDEFQQAGWDVVATDSGENALAILGTRRVDLLVTDIRLGGDIDGWEVAAKARTNYPGVPVIYATAQLADASLCVPESAFIPKPYVPAVVVEKGYAMIADLIDP
jgi:CheY-like chemotaxis protein